MLSGEVEEMSVLDCRMMFVCFKGFDSAMPPLAGDAALETAQARCTG